MAKLRWIIPFTLLGLGFAFSCGEQTTGGGARAYQVVDRSALIGGPMALGDLGDFMLENSQIRVVLSKVGISRAFGLFGGNIVDADRVRGGTGRGSSGGGQGADSLVEMFPLFFLGAVDPKSSTVVNDGSNGKPAVLRIKGEGASFIALTESINNFVTFPEGKNRLDFQLDYTLQPGKNYIELAVKVTNKKEKIYRFGNILGKKIPSMTGMVGIFGKRNKVFIPGTAGYNIRFALQGVFKNRLNPPAIPGLVGDFVASWGQNGVSYGFVAAPTKENYVIQNKKEYDKLKVPIHEGSLIVPMEGSSITAAFTKQAPYTLKQNESFTFKMYIVVGDGSVASIRNAQLDIHKKPKGLVSGLLVSEETYAPIADAHIIAYQGKTPTNGVTPKPGDRMFYTDMRTDAQGRFQGYLEPGTYTLIARQGMLRSKTVVVEVKKDQRIFKQLTLPQWGYIAYTIRDQKGRLLPSKVMVLGKVKDFVYQGKKGHCAGKDPLYCLYDPHLGEGKIDSDFAVGLTCKSGKKCATHRHCKGDGDGQCAYRLAPETEYRESVHYSMRGLGRIAVRPGTYRIVASRGIEYELGEETGVQIKAGKVTEIALTLVHSVPTPKAISTDLHVHTNLSHDVSISDRSRLASFVGEGVDTFVATDHNRVRDMQPLVLSFQIERWLKTFVGVELTTFEMGHFNAFPLKLDANAFNGGNPNWFKEDKRYDKDPSFPKNETPRPLKGLRLGVAPGEMFARLRQRGSLCDNDRNCKQTIIQVNHPRDSIFGYFNTYSLSADTGFPTFKKTGVFANPTQPLSQEFDANKFSLKFDAIEVFNGARFDLMWHWKIPPLGKAPLGYAGGPGTKIRINSNGKADIAFPGGVDDWFNLLNRGLTMTATANSDSHNHDPEAGYPRSYLLTGFDDHQKLEPKQLSSIILKNKVMMTNGPILEVQAKSGGKTYDIGATIPAKGKITFSIRVRAASWIDITEVLVYKNGKLVRTIPVTEKRKVERFSRDIEFDISDGDAWFVFVTKGQKGLWPVLRSEEIEPFQISEAVALIQDALLGNLPLDIGGGDPVCLAPSIVRQVSPYALTNPFWVDTDGDGKYTPNPCKTLGDRGIRCSQKGTSCKQGYCLDKAAACKEDSDCKQVDLSPYSRCIDGQCSVDPCTGVTCASEKNFTVCSDTEPCPLDSCPAKDKRCKDGSKCSKDADCAGKGDGLCRYCACPAARKACPDGRSCTSNADCGGKECASKRLCAPTACSLGYCVPTYPTCKLQDQEKDTHLFLRSSKKRSMDTLSTSTPIVPFKQTLKTSYQRVNYHTLHKQMLKGKKTSVDMDRFTIKKAKSFFLFFEHKH